MNEGSKMILLETALSKLREILRESVLPREVVQVRRAAGRFLLSDVHSRLDLPPFNKSAMDGYAILPGDERREYRLLETIPAGRVSRAKLLSGTTTKVMTGAAVPAGAGKVVMVEYASERDGIVTISEHGSASNICQKGEDVKVGQMSLAAGRRLDGVDISNIIACGVDEVEVSRQIKVAVISTGDEIVDSFEELSPGKIMNSNGPMLSALCRKYGFEVVEETSIEDDKEALESGLTKALSSADMIVLSGGVSVGEYDYVPEIMHKLGLKLHFTRVAIKPGKPTTFASRKGKAVLGLPGNPVAVYLTFHLFVLRAAALMSGVTQGEIREFKVRLAQDFRRRKSQRRDYVPCRLNRDGEAEALEFHGSAHLAALVDADGFFVVQRGVLSLAAGEGALFIPTKVKVN